MPETETKQRGHFTLKAATQVVTDEGVFEAVISTASVDREKDIVEPSALVAALRKWNRPIPLAWNHSTEAEDLIGSIEPLTAREQDREVIVQGTVDLESKRGAEAWRSFKSGTIGFSYGYLVPEGGSKDRRGGGKHITELDVFEVTATPTPMNNDTRVVSWKSVMLKRLQSELSRQLNKAGTERFKVDDRGYVYLDDYDPDAGWAVFAVFDKDSEKYLKINFTTDSDGVTLADGQTEVERVVQYKAPGEKKADETDGRREPRSVDPLREDSRRAVAGIRLDGVPERKSPPTEPEPRPEPPSEKELREQFRDVTMQLLRGT